MIGAPLAGDESVAGGCRRHDTPFSFDIVLQPADGDTSLAEVARGGKWRLHTPFAFELILPGSGTVESAIAANRQACRSVLVA